MSLQARLAKGEMITKKKPHLRRDRFNQPKNALACTRAYNQFQRETYKVGWHRFNLWWRQQKQIRKAQRRMRKRVRRGW